MSTALDAQLYGVDMFGHSMRPPLTSPVAQKFLVSPFSVLNAREGDWQDRKRAWVAMGIQSEQGRNGCASKLAMSETIQREKPSADPAITRQMKALEPGGGGGPNSCWIRPEEGAGTSIFDPVLCELAYRWWSGEGAQILDPFAGGSVRGIVAAHLGRKYWGCDLRDEQIEANRVQGAALCEGKPMPEWVCGDSMNEVEKAPEADFIFSCPPYGDLEQYSELREDLSAMPWPDFRLAYRAIIHRACKRLKNDRFACFVVGDFRDGKGNYRNFVSETIAAFLDAGLALYNEAILVTSVGSASMRVTRQFNGGRKLCKTHQNVLVFVKGDGRAAANEATRGAAADFTGGGGAEQAGDDAATKQSGACSANVPLQRPDSTTRASEPK
jgi:hypothetical protein